MKALTTPAGNFGPFKSIEVLADRYRCDNTDLPFSVVGQGQIVDADTIDWPAPPVPVPEVVTMRQARLALLQAGKLADVDAAILALPSPDKETAQISWEYATEVRRDSDLVKQLAPVLGLDDAAIDALFIQAATL
jgi:hypothetical protein